MPDTDGILRLISLQEEHRKEVVALLIKEELRGMIIVAVVDIGEEGLKSVLLENDIEMNHAGINHLPMKNEVEHIHPKPPHSCPSNTAHGPDASS